jgi:hypothetical protein
MNNNVVIYIIAIALVYKFVGPYITTYFYKHTKGRSNPSNYIRELIFKLGPPSFYDIEKVIWNEPYKGTKKLIILDHKKKSICPIPHYSFVYSITNIKMSSIDIDKFKGIGNSITFDSKKRVIVQSNKVLKNQIMLGFIDDIINKRITFDKEILSKRLLNNETTKKYPDILNEATNLKHPNITIKKEYTKSKSESSIQVSEHDKIKSLNVFPKGVLDTQNHYVPPIIPQNTSLSYNTQTLNKTFDATDKGSAESNDSFPNHSRILPEIGKVISENKKESDNPLDSRTQTMDELMGYSETDNFYKIN